MNSMTNIFGNITRLIIRNKSKLLIYLGLGGMIKTTFDVAMISPKIKENIKNAEKENNKDLTAKEIIKLTWKDVLPIALQASLSSALIIAGDISHTNNAAALATAYSITAQNFNDYKKKIKETLSEEQVKNIDDKLAEDTINKQKSSNVILTGNGKQLCFEYFTEQSFEADPITIRRIFMELFETSYRNDGIITLADWLYAINAGLRIPDYAYRVGWRLDQGKANWPDIYMSGELNDNYQPMIVVKLSFEPELIRN